MLDEAQDTHGAQLDLLNTLFAQGVAFQRMGDQNQTLYEDPEIPQAGYWQVQGAIPLNESRRFGTEIAAFVSRLTARSPQQIVGVEGQPCRRALLLFDKDSIARVVPEYASEVRAHWGAQLSSGHEIWAVASRHSLYRPRGEWLKSLVDYCPDYRTGTDKQRKPENLCAAMRQASVLHERNKQPADILELVALGIADVLRCSGLTPGESITSRNVWRILGAQRSDLSLKIRRLVRDRIFHGRAAWGEVEWQTFCAELQTILNINQPGPALLIAYLEFNSEGALEDQNPAQQASRALFEYDGVQVRLGSIHSVKGRTVDAILVVETEVWRGPSREEQVMDLTTVLPHAFGIEEKDFNASSAMLSAATNVFVGASRPKQVLCLAMRKANASPELLAAALAQGWNIRDLMTV